MTASSSTSQNSAIFRLMSGSSADPSAEQDVRLNADGPQIAHAVLRRLGLELAGGADVRHQRQVDVSVLSRPTSCRNWRIASRKGRLDVADRAADFDEHDVHVRADRANRVFDLVGDVRDDLHRPAGNNPRRSFWMTLE
jgi:hypothetical protein